MMPFATGVYAAESSACPHIPFCIIQGRTFKERECEEAAIDNVRREQE